LQSLNFARLLNARVLFALLFIWKAALDGKTNPSNTKAMATFPPLAYICAAYGCFRWK